MRWVICIWSGPSADGLDPHLAPNAAMPSMDPRMARHGQARRGSHAIRGWSMPSADSMDPRLAPNRSVGRHCPEVCGKGHPLAGQDLLRALLLFCVAQIFL